MNQPLKDLVVVLYEPQDDINIGSVLRVAENFGVGTLRLVRPASADPSRILISAPRTQERIAEIQTFDTLEESLTDCLRVYGTTARSRRANMELASPPEVAAEMQSYPGRVALVFGREDSGLPNDALDRCDVLVTIPTNPDYSSLNLAQAVLICVWEAFKASSGPATLASGGSEPEFPPASRGQVERMLVFAEEALESVEFFKGPNQPQVMRSVRSVFARAHIDERELAIWFGIWKEIPAFLKRTGRDQGPDS